MKQFFIAVLLLCFGTIAQGATRPNIVYILADDLGYGDVQCMNPERSQIPTPHMDQLAADGMIFTDVHSSSSVCTPTRYGILTGRYNWRTRLQRHVLYGFSAPLLADDRLTVAELLKAQGYHTAAIGKWHLGLGIPTTNGKAASGNGNNVDWQGVITDGPVDHGFDYFYGISASLDMPPYIYIENNRFVGECTTVKQFHRPGPAEADFEAVNVLPDIAQKSVQYIQQQTATKPFFMYIALTSPHTPILPAEDWQGRSQLGVYADFVMQTDAVIGQITEAIDQAGLGQNTIVIVTSDNGCSANRANYRALEKAGHFVSAQFRGSKADLWDGGHRVPFIVRWPAVVSAGAKSDELLCLTDLMATAAELSGATIPAGAGEDSISFLPALTGRSIVSTRAGVVHHSIDGYFAYRAGKWKLLLARGSGGWTAPKEAQAIQAGAPMAQLYDMERDPGETTNLYNSHPEIANRLLQQLESDVARGRSTAGVDLNNDVDIVLWKEKAVGQK